MKINSIDIKKFNAKQMKVVFQPASRQTKAEWNQGQKLPTEYETTIGFSTLKVSIYFKGSSRSSVQRNIAEFLALINGAVDIELDHYKGKYKGFLKNDPTTSDTKELNKKTLNLEFKGYMFDDEIKVVVNGNEKKEVQLVGARNAPCVLEIHATDDVSDMIIKGFGNDDIVVSELKKDKTLIIDGVLGIATIDGLNAFDVVDIWEFPYIANRTMIQMSSRNAEMTIRYNPMWV